MPLDWGPGQLLEENYKTFISSVGRLTRMEQENARGGFGPRREISQHTPAVVLPGWDDVLVLGPRQTVTKAQWKSFYAQERGGPDAQLDPFTRNEIARRQRARDRFEHSPSPAWAREFGTALTALDNVQDLLSTAAVVGRFVVRPFPVIHPVAGPVLKVLTAVATAVNVLGLLGIVISPVYGMLCSEPGDALAAGMVSMLRGRALKQLATGVTKSNRRARLVAGARAGPRSWLPAKRARIPALIEGAQVSKDLFGWGLSFGAVVGAVNDAAFGAEQLRRGQAVELRTPRAPHAYHALLADVLARYDTEALVDARLAANVWAWAPWLLGPDSPLDDVERQQTLYAHYVAAELLAPVVTHPRFVEAMDRALADEWTAPHYAWSDTAEALAEGGGVDARARRGWPTASPRPRLTGDELVALAHDLVDAYWDAIDLVPTWRPERAALELLTTRVMERTAILMLGAEDTIAWRLATPWALAEGLLDSGTWLDVHSDPRAVERLAETFERQREKSGNVMRTRASWIALAHAHGVRAFPILDADEIPGPTSS